MLAEFESPSGATLMTWLLIILAVILFGLLTGFRVAQQYERGVVFRLGRYAGTRGPGLFWIIPLGVETVTKVDMRVLTDSVEQQETMTKDNVPIQVNAVIWYRVVKPDRAIIQVQNFRAAVVQVALTTLRNGLGQYTLDDVLKERDKLSVALKDRVDQVTEPWGRNSERRDAQCEDPGHHAARDGSGSRGIARKARAHHQGGSRTRSGAQIARSRRRDHENAGVPRTAAHADADRSGRGAEQHDDRHDAIRIRRRCSGSGTENLAPDTAVLRRLMTSGKTAPGTQSNAQQRLDLDSRRQFQSEAGGDRGKKNRGLLKRERRTEADSRAGAKWQIGISIHAHPVFAEEAIGVELVGTLPKAPMAVNHVRRNDRHREEGRARAVARGVKMGRKPKLTAYQQREALKCRERGEPVCEIGRSYNVSHSTISRLGA
jgi:hypothetical protein